MHKLAERVLDVFAIAVEKDWKWTQRPTFLHDEATRLQITDDLKADL